MMPRERCLPSFSVQGFRCSITDRPEPDVDGTRIITPFTNLDQHSLHLEEALVSVSFCVLKERVSTLCSVDVSEQLQYSKDRQIPTRSLIRSYHTYSGDPPSRRLSALWLDGHDLCRFLRLPQFHRSIEWPGCPRFMFHCGLRAVLSYLSQHLFRLCAPASVAATMSSQTYAHTVRCPVYRPSSPQFFQGTCKKN